MSRRCVKFMKRLPLPAAIVQKVEKIIEACPECGYKDVEAFVEDSVRRRVEQVKERIEERRSP